LDKVHASVHIDRVCRLRVPRGAAAGERIASMGPSISGVGARAEQSVH
jgi:hypothetical protein